MANTAMGRGMNAKEAQLANRAVLYSALIMSILLYGSETMTLSNSESIKLQFLNIMMQSEIMWFEHVTNTSVQDWQTFQLS